MISRLGGKSVLTPYDIFALRLITASAILLPFVGSMPARAWADRRVKRTRDAIRDEPMRATLYALGIGVIIGLLAAR